MISKKILDKNKAKPGFTLAEALIAMMIIGVIAMLVLPGLKKYSSKHAFAAQLKKDYMTLNTSLDAVFADDYDIEIEDIGGDKFFTDKMVPTFNVVLTCDATNMKESEEGKLDGCFGADIQGLSITPNNAVILADGSTIGNNNMEYIVDVNGPALPNVVGADIFTYELKKVKGDNLDPSASDEESAGTAGTLAMFTPMLHSALNSVNNALIPAAYAAVWTETPTMQGDDVFQHHYGDNISDHQSVTHGGGGGGGGGGSSRPNGNVGPEEITCMPGYDCDEDGPGGGTPGGGTPGGGTPGGGTPGGGTPGGGTPGGGTPGGGTPGGGTPGGGTPGGGTPGSSTGTGSVTDDGTYTAGWKFVPTGVTVDVMNNGWKIKDWDNKEE